LHYFLVPKLFDKIATILNLKACRQASLIKSLQVQETFLSLFDHVLVAEQTHSTRPEATYPTSHITMHVIPDNLFTEGSSHLSKLYWPCVIGGKRGQLSAATIIF